MMGGAEKTSFADVEVTLKAFVHIAPDSTEATKTGSPASALGNATLAVKDLFDVKDMPTSFGSEIYADNMATSTAEAVRRAEKAGATVIGKTVTTEFATFKPGPTTNPQNPAYTPGGSSSGSAAAVGAGLASHALGTQTAGSVIRPAAFCGVVGFLPSMGLVSRDGLKVVSPTLDRVGVFARSVQEAVNLADVIADLPKRREYDTSINRVGFFSSSTWKNADEDTRFTIQAFKETVQKCGDHAIDLGSGERLFELADAQSDIMQYEIARSLSYELANHQNLISDDLDTYCRGGFAIGEEQYKRALEIGRSGRDWIASIFNNVQLIVSPSARSLPPKTLSSTGDPFINRAWSLLYLPCITMPTSPLSSNLKGAVQFVGAFEHDRDLIAHAMHYEERISNIRRWPTSTI